MRCKMIIWIGTVSAGLFLPSTEVFSQQKFKDVVLRAWEWSIRPNKNLDRSEFLELSGSILNNVTSGTLNTQNMITAHPSAIKQVVVDGFYLSLWADYSMLAFSTPEKKISAIPIERTMRTTGRFSEWKAAIELNYRF